MASVSPWTVVRRASLRKADGFQLEARSKAQILPKKRFDAWKDRFDGLSETAVKAAETVPDEVKHFLADDEFREYTLKEAAKALRKLTTERAKEIAAAAEKKTEDLKEAAAALMDGGEMSDEQKEALESAATRIGVKAGFDALEASVLSGAKSFNKGLASYVASKALGRALKNPKGVEGPPEEAIVHLVVGAMGKEINGLDDKGLTEVLEKMKPEKTKTSAARVASRFIEASDIRVVNVDFVGDRQPRWDGDPDFTADVTVTFDVSGMALARLFGKQRRVLEGFLEKLDEKTAIKRIEAGGSRTSQIMRAIEPEVNDLIIDYNLNEFDSDSKVRDFTPSEDTSFWEADIDPRKQRIRYTIEVDAHGLWQ